MDADFGQFHAISPNTSPTPAPPSHTPNPTGYLRCQLNAKTLADWDLFASAHLKVIMDNNYHTPSGSLGSTGGSTGGVWEGGDGRHMVEMKVVNQVSH